jgi:anti-sigma B factor antagonist
MFWMRVRSCADESCADQDCAVVEWHGELDLAFVASAGGPLMAIVARERKTILDLAGLHFMDCSGIGVMVRARLHAGQSGHELVLAALQPIARKVLALTGAGSMFPTYASVTAAADPALVPESVTGPGHR